MPHLRGLVEELKDDPVCFIGITDEPLERIEAFLGKRKFPGWIAIDSDRSAFETYGVTGIPRTFVIDPSGRLAMDTRPENLTAELLRAVADGSYKQPAPAKETSGLPRIGGFMPGLDPLCMPWVRAGLFEPGFYYQSILRPSFGGGGHGTRGDGRGAIGITLVNHTVPEIFRFVYDLPTTLRVVDQRETDSSAGFDVVYSRPSGSSKAKAQVAIGRMVEEAKGLNTAFIRADRAVLVASIDTPQWIPHDQVDWEHDPAAKSLRSAPVLLTELESRLGTIVLCDDSDFSSLFLDMYAVETWELSAQAYRAFLEGRGVTFRRDRREVELLAIYED